MHPHESLIRTHVEGEGSERERQEVDEHLKGCSECREFLAFTQDFSETVKGMNLSPTSSTGCAKTYRASSTSGICMRTPRRIPGVMVGGIL